jgi:hypothetical protein
MGTPHYMPILNLKPFKSFLQHHLLQAKDKISELNRGLKEVVRVHCLRTELLEAMKQSLEIIQTLEEELNPKGESLNEANEISLRVAESLCSLRTAFSYKQWPP